MQNLKIQFLPIRIAKVKCWGICSFYDCKEVAKEYKIMLHFGRELGNSYQDLTLIPFIQQVIVR